MGRVVFERALDDQVAIVRLDNPARKNAINLVMWQQLAEFSAEVAADIETRAVIITGSADIFSAGADISDFDTARLGDVSAKSYDDLVEQTCCQIEAIPQPTICAIEGPCVGAGASLACSCDIRVASDSAFFAVPAARLGLGYDPRGISRFVRIFGHAMVANILLTAAKLSAASAQSVGAVRSLHAPGHIEAEALAVARTISSNAPLTLRAAKLSLRALASADEGLSERALELCALADQSDDYREGREAFRDGRKPVFRGH